MVDPAVDPAVDPGAGDPWSVLLDRARGVTAMAYAPYSGYAVGAAALVDDGRVVVGCNVENASYGLTLCAECGLVSALHASGGGRLVRFVCVDAQGAVIMACGRCRQLLWEHGGPGLEVLTPRGVATMSEVLPSAFDAGALDQVAVGGAGVGTGEVANSAAEEV